MPRLESPSIDTILANGESSTLNPNATPFVPSQSYLYPDATTCSDRISSATVHDAVFDRIISIDNIIKNIKVLPKRKAPGRDSLRAEMLVPIQKTLSQILSYLFALSYQWSYTPSDWRRGHVCSIYKKGPVTEASSFRPISLTSTIRKLFELCLAPLVIDVSPTIDVAQNGFHSSRSALDGALSLQDFMEDYH